ncbi:MAG TPA: hypothetical protein VLN47_05975 [Clostridiaceae bacterium]|nr:hypothetical protein [Clostridiaceae bacterium]
MERKNSESTNDKTREMIGGAAIISNHILLDFAGNNLHKYHKQNLSEKNLVITSYETEYIDPFDGNKVKDIRKTVHDGEHEVIEDFITEPGNAPAAHQKDEEMTPWEMKFYHDEMDHAPFETPVDQLSDEGAVVTETVVSNIEAANMNNYDMRNLRTRNHVITRHETEYLDPFDGYKLKDIRDSIG